MSAGAAPRLLESILLLALMLLSMIAVPSRGAQDELSATGHSTKNASCDPSPGATSSCEDGKCPSGAPSSESMGAGPTPAPG